GDRRGTKNPMRCKTKQGAVGRLPARDEKCSRRSRVIVASARLYGSGRTAFLKKEKRREINDHPVRVLKKMRTHRIRLTAVRLTRALSENQTKAPSLLFFPTGNDINVIYPLDVRFENFVAPCG